MANKNLSNAKKAKNDEFYTQYADIDKEVQAYLAYDRNVFRGKTVYCNCDDPYTSEFFKYFAGRFNYLGLRRLLAASYDPSPIAGTQLPFEDIAGMKGSERKAYVFDTSEMPDLNKDGVADIYDTELLMRTVKEVVRPLEGNGDFRSAECIELLKQADIVVTNPPFSLFREYLAQLVEYDKQFLIIGNLNAITYKEVFPLLKENKIWLGNGFNAGNAYFATPTADRYGEGVYNPETGLVKFRNVCWFTNLDHGRRHQRFVPMSMERNLRFNDHGGKVTYQKYDNYDAIEVPYTDAIPSDYEGIMGVPISFFDKYNPDQFELLGSADDKDWYVPVFGHYDGRITLNGKQPFKRVFIRQKN
jgi:hypothetical protein